MFEAIISKIEQYDSIVIFGHLNPDGDCYGSQIALRNILKLKYPNKQIYCVGSGLKKFFDIIGKMDVVSDEVIAQSLAIVLDSNDINRLEDQRAWKARDFAKIDHHIDTFTFHEGPEVIDDTATSTCELIYLFAKENNFEIDLISASALYLGMMTDTARFQFANNFVRMFEIARDLCDRGVDPILLNKTNNLVPEINISIKSFIYSHVKKDRRGIIYAVATKEDREKLGVTSAQICANTSLLSYVVGFPVWLIASETDNGGMQVEMRSSTFDIQKIATHFGGGGHTFAAGFTYKKFGQDVLNELLDLLADTVKKGNE
ncbi:MAG: bifunctional oligoribonuclease/PAP phosphatase NrnA [Bacilli bacterium]|nr:bifunctional oligoribonuclease/PAP phosphatase NrnA [Bacilli bacterium]